MLERRRGLALATAWSLILAGCGGLSERQPAPPAKPNIVLIVADDLGYGDLGAYGQERIRTPNIDALARRGLRFTDFYAGSTVCAPSRAALMTGLHTGHAQVRGNREVRPMGQHPLAEGTETVARILQRAGYRTGLFGKWGLGGPGSTGEPNRQGFDEFFGYLCQRHAHNYYPEFLFRNAERVPLRNVLPEPKREDGAGVASEKVDYSHDLIAAEALAFLDRAASGPFFLALTAALPHANNEGGQDGMEVPDLGPYAGEDWPERQKQLAAMISRLDADVGRVAAKLDELGLSERTLVLFTSDNGPHREGGNDPEYFRSSGPLRGIKRDLYEGGIRVPLIAVWPGRVAEGRTTAHAGAFWDFLPTFAELAGAAAPEGLDGLSMVPVLEGREREQARHEFLYWEFHEAAATKQAARMGDWKGVRHAPSGPLELYDLASDLGETRDVAANNPEVVRRIEAILAAARVDHEHWPLKDAAR